jgi:hypothetical protein
MEYAAPPDDPVPHKARRRSNPIDADTSPITRRALIGKGVPAAAAAVSALADVAGAPPAAQAAAQGNPTGAIRRKQKAYEIRRDCARRYLSNRPANDRSNGDETRYDDKRASFSKTLPHNEIGEVDPTAYAAWLAILQSGEPTGFEHVPRATGAEVKLNNPQACYAFDLVGTDSHATHLDPPPAFASARMAVEMAELYWQALLADVPFRRYESDPLAVAAVADLNAFSEALRPPAGPKPTVETLFRGETAGARTGPYVSQFLLLNIPYGIATIEQRYRVPTRGQSFLIQYPDWIACQNGKRPGAKLLFDAQPRFICSNRELAKYVHQDFSFQAYMNAALIMLSFGEDALSPANPYRGSKTQFGDITFGHKNILSMLAQAALLGQKGAYFHKWLVHRRLRPESFGGRIETHLSGRKPYDIHSDILRCDGVARVKAANGTSLLPVAYPEGSPTHPSYPAAHACNAGACATILKAFFNQDFAIPAPVQSTIDGSALEAWNGPILTLGGEIEKLAENISLARDAAGVHFRSDSIRGLRVGEEQAIGLLSDYSQTYHERFDGFFLTKFDGTRVRIVAGSVHTR